MKGDRSAICDASTAAGPRTSQWQLVPFAKGIDEFASPVC